MTAASPITVQTTVNAPVAKVWQCWTEPEHITQWNAASDDWHCPRAVNDLREGGAFSARMEAKDGSQGFDFGGTYTKVVEHREIAYTLGDKRNVRILFEEQDGKTQITETFDPESTFPPELQRQGWQAILDHFTRHVEAD